MPDDVGVALVPREDSAFASQEVLAGRLQRTANKRSPTAADAVVGRRIRDLRSAIGMPLSELSARIGVSQPQLYRYEAGLTRVAASRLITIAGALGVSVEVLMGPQEPAGSPNPGTRAEVDLLLRAFSSIARAERRSALIALARSMAEHEATSGG